MLKILDDFIRYCVQCTLTSDWRILKWIWSQVLSLLFIFVFIIHISIDGYWNKNTRKQFFDDFAKDYQFDPLIPPNWYNMDKSLLKSRRVRNKYSVLIPHFHINILRRDLEQLFIIINTTYSEHYRKLILTLVWKGRKCILKIKVIILTGDFRVLILNIYIFF